MFFHDRCRGDEDRFLEEMASFMSNHTEFGTLIILDESFQIILPGDLSSKEVRESLAEEFAADIQRGTLRNHSFYETGDGMSFWVGFSTLRTDNLGKLYIIVYRDTALATTQIDRLEMIYLQIAVFSSLLYIVISLLFYWNHCRYMQLLSDEILRIGEGDFSRLVLPSSIGVTERVRRSINTMMEKIQLSMNRRETLGRSVNHFIRNHLMAVNGYAQGIETGVFSPEDGAAKIRMESMRMEELLHNLSVQSYIEEQTMPKNDEVLCLADQITVRVEDDGKGISDKDLPHLFQPLFKGRKGNLGFGLPVAQDAAKYMGGRLSAENRPEGGAVFILSLPS